MDPTTSLSTRSEYFCLKKNKLKWTSTLADLKAFLLDEEKAANSSWRSPSGGTWVFESDQLKVTWHSKSENISFEGASGKDLAERIISLLARADKRVKANPVEAELSLVKSIEINESGDKNDLGVNNSMNEVIMTSTVVDLDLPLSNDGLNDEIIINHEEAITQAENTRSKSCVQSVPQDLHTANTSLSPSGGIDESHGCDSETCLLRLRFERFTDNVTNKLTNLANEISNIVENKPYSIVVLESLIDEHKKEKAELSKANEELKEQNTGMSHTISDLHNSIDVLQNEKASLLSIIRLLQS